MSCIYARAYCLRHSTILRFVGRAPPRPSGSMRSSRNEPTSTQPDPGLTPSANNRNDPAGCTADAPAGPAAPVAPVAPFAPVAPVAPVAPLAPVGPAGPLGPAGPIGPVGPGG